MSLNFLCPNLQPALFRFAHASVAALLFRHTAREDDSECIERVAIMGRGGRGRGRGGRRGQGSQWADWGYASVDWNRVHWSDDWTAGHDDASADWTAAGWTEVEDGHWEQQWPEQTSVGWEDAISILHSEDDRWRVENSDWRTDNRTETEVADERRPEEEPEYDGGRHTTFFDSGNGEQCAP